MTHGMTHGERHARRHMAESRRPGVEFMAYVVGEKRVSRWRLFIWSLNGLIPCMDEEQLRERYGDSAYLVLYAPVAQDTRYVKKDKKKPRRSMKRGKRRLMPSDYAWLLRESGKRYGTAPDPRLFLNSPRSGHKRLTEEEREQQRNQRLQDWWTKRTDEIATMKVNAGIRRAKKRLKHFRESIFNRREQEAAQMRTVQDVAFHDAGPRTAFVRVKPELYDIVACGECPVFVWKERPGQEDMFQPNEYGPVKRVAVRPPGSSEKTPWAVFELEWSRRKLRETNTGSEWVWEIGLGDRIKEEDE